MTILHLYIFYKRGIQWRKMTAGCKSMLNNGCYCNSATWKSKWGANSTNLNSMVCLLLTYTSILQGTPVKKMIWNTGRFVPPWQDSQGHPGSSPFYSRNTRQFWQTHSLLQDYEDAFPGERWGDLLLDPFLIPLYIFLKSLSSVSWAVSDSRWRCREMCVQVTMTHLSACTGKSKYQASRDHGFMLQVSCPSRKQEWFPWTTRTAQLELGPPNAQHSSAKEQRTRKTAPEAGTETGSKGGGKHIQR